MCRQLGKETTDPREITEFLGTIDAIKIIQVQRQLFTAEVIPYEYLIFFELISKKNVGVNNLFCLADTIKESICSKHR